MKVQLTEKLFGFLQQYFALIFAALAIFALLVVAGIARADSVSQTFSTSTNLVAGNVVSLSQNSSTQVVAATPDNSDRLVGVVTNPQASLVNLDATGGNVQVVTNGLVSTLTSEINGTIHNGDPLTSSPIIGVAMKATGSARIIGFASSDFSAATQKTTQKITNKSNQQIDVTVGVLPVQVAVSDYRAAAGLDSNGIVAGVQSLAVSATGKSISPARAVVALIVLLVAVIVSFVILYTTLVGSIRSIGRNPLSKHTILITLVQVLVAVVIIMMSGFVITYLILTR